MHCCCCSCHHQRITILTITQMCVPVCSCSILVQAGRVPPPPIPHSQGRERCAHQGHHRRRGRVQGLPQWHRGLLQSERSAGRAIAGRVCCASQGSFKGHMAARSPAHSHTLHTMHMHFTYCMRLKLLSFALPNHRPDSTELMVRPTSTRSSRRCQPHSRQRTLRPVGGLLLYLPCSCRGHLGGASATCPH